MLQSKRGDKVKIKRAEFKGERGIVVSVSKKRLFVQIAGAAAPVSVHDSDVTNYSLAARKAWENMPDRRVGRPKGSRTSDRVSVTLRIDRELWQQFREAERVGKIADRTQTINGWLREKLTELTVD